MFMRYITNKHILLEILYYFTQLFIVLYRIYTSFHIILTHYDITNKYYQRYHTYIFQIILEKYILSNFNTFQNIILDTNLHNKLYKLYYFTQFTDSTELYKLLFQILNYKINILTILSWEILILYNFYKLQILDNFSKLFQILLYKIILIKYYRYYKILTLEILLDYNFFRFQILDNFRTFQNFSKIFQILFYKIIY